ncbi:MAG: hypothetical protein KTR19_10370 [Hyphomicrobiales bacterium]|nr:hypothetical protein [Hyphomicrobiales bacterium]
MAKQLRLGQTRLETTTKVTLAVLALASGVYTYLGVRGLLNGTPSVVFFGAVIYSAAVSVGIYAFWSYLMRFLPHIESASARLRLYIAMAIGSGMIIAMSSWLNAAALAGSAALEQHMANATETYQQQFDRAHSNALAAQSLLPDIQLASQRFASLAEQERASGALTGTSGSGTVVQLLTQMSTEMNRLALEVEDSRAQVKQRFEQGGRHLARMRELVSNSGPIDARANAFGEEALKLIGEINALEQTSVAPSVKRTAADLSKTFIAPIADGADLALQQRQTEVVGRVENAVRLQSQALASAADEILNREPAQVPRFQPLSPPEAVLLYAEDFLPSWAGAISIDLLPAVLIFIMITVEGAIRRHESGAELDAETMSAADVMRGTQLFRQMQVRFAEDQGAMPPVGPAGNASADAPEPEMEPPIEDAHPENIARLNPPKS